METCQKSVAHVSRTRHETTTSWSTGAPELDLERVTFATFPPWSRELERNHYRYFGSTVLVICASVAFPLNDGRKTRLFYDFKPSNWLEITLDFNN